MSRLIIDSFVRAKQYVEAVDMAVDLSKGQIIGTPVLLVVVPAKGAKPALKAIHFLLDKVHQPVIVALSDRLAPFCYSAMSLANSSATESRKVQFYVIPERAAELEALLAKKDLGAGDVVVFPLYN